MKDVGLTVKQSAPADVVAEAGKLKGKVKPEYGKGMDAAPILSVKAKPEGTRGRDAGSIMKLKYKS